MCGFGDKVGVLALRTSASGSRLTCFFLQDRRPITPPPCIRLIVRDEHTEKEIDIKYVENAYVLI